MPNMLSRILSSLTALPIWSVDDYGNTRQDGVLNLKTNTAPTQVEHGYLGLYTSDGSSLSTIDASGTENAITVGTNGGSVIIPDTTANKAAGGTTINSAIAALPSNGGTIVIPAGTWTIDTPILISKSGVILQGVGNSATLLNFAGSTVTTCIKNADTTARFCQIRNLRIESTDVGAGTAIDGSYLQNSVFSDVRIGASSKTPNKGIVFNAIGSYYNRIKDCRVSVSGASSQCIAFDTTSNSNVVTNCRLVGDASTTGVYVNSHAIEINRVDCESTMSIGIDVAASGHDCTIVSPYLEAIATGIRLASGVESTTVLGGVIIDCTTANITDNGASGPQFINVRVQYDPYTSVKATNVPVYTINGAPVPSGTYAPSDLGFLSWAYDPATTSNSTLTTNGTVYLARVVLRFAQTITNLSVGISTAATTPTANQSFLGLYDSTGTRVAVTAAGAIDAALASSGILTQAVVTPYAAAAGVYWVAFVNNAATAATLARASGSSLTIANGGASAANLRFAVNGTGATSLAASITPSSNTTAGAFTMWAAVS